MQSPRLCYQLFQRVAIPLTATLVISKHSSSCFALLQGCGLTRCDAAHDRNHGILHSSTRTNAKSSSRIYSTAADKYYRQHGKIPMPSVPHVVLNVEINEKEKKNEPNSTKRSGILVIGDVHGCYEELLQLHQTAIQVNGDQDFEFVILVGDLCNKGPQSVQVIRHVRQNASQWLTVRGNHDNGALAAALGDERRRSKPSYAWIFAENALSDDDVMWMAELPYSIRIPGRLLDEAQDTVVVHAGLVPGIKLEEQSAHVMVNLREVERQNGQFRAAQDDCDSKKKQPWGKLWARNGEPFHVIFGHDARRGLQRYDNDHVIGLDTGACYGKRLSAVVLSSKGKRTIISVPASRVHCPISGAK